MTADEEWDMALDLARELNEYFPTETRFDSAPPNGSDRPGDRFNATADWGKDVFINTGWTWLFTRNSYQHWRRPGKEDPGNSATTGVRSDCGKDLLYVFSTNATPFEAGRSYSKFSAYALLHHNGDFRAAARHLAANGYSDPSLPAGRIKCTANGDGASATDTPSSELTWSVSIDGEVVAEGNNDALVALGYKRSKTVYQDFPILKLRDILTMDLPDPVWAIPGILAEGLNLLAGSPKSGKSMLALNLALTVAGGGMALGMIPTVAGDVLYLSLEDQLWRVKARAKRMAALIGRSTPERLSVVTKWPRMDRGGIALLDHWVQRSPTPRLVIIDVLGKFRAPSRERGNQYEQDSECMYQIKDFLDEHKINGLVMHHTRKLVGKDKDRDEMEDVSGTQGLAGGCDGVLMLKRARQSNDALLSLTGRDDAEKKLFLQFDPEALTWSSRGSAEEYLRGQFQQKVLEYMKSRAGNAVFPTEIVTVLDANDSAVRATLYRLGEKGFITRQNNAWVYPAAATV